MESIGQILKAARERRQMSVSDVAAATRIKIEYVEAIEADRFQDLPAPVYARGFVRLVAESVGVDPLALLQRYSADRRTAGLPAASAPPAPRRAGRLPPGPGARAPGRLVAFRCAWGAARCAAGRRVARLTHAWRQALPDVPSLDGRRLALLGGVVLLLLAAGLAWHWSTRGLPVLTDDCRWVAGPPVPYLESGPPAAP